MRDSRSRPIWRSVAVFFGYHSFHFRKDFVCEEHPIHRNRVAPLRRTAHLQPAHGASSDRYLDLAARNNVPANQAVTFVIQRTPRPKLIELPQYVEFFCVR